jgi:hypothetical protein
VEKYCRPRQATNDNAAQAHFMMDMQDYKNTLVICNSYCFSTATIVTTTHLSVTLHELLPLLLLRSLEIVYNMITNDLLEIKLKEDVEVYFTLRRLKLMYIIFNVSVPT